jgi:7,8-dihydropterin-6-yl-methyl-4-(beta-D-ribofuranosyl)aminobenzene 5'-phosphate synthase
MQHRSRMREDLCFYNGGEEGFREKFLGDPKEPISWGYVDRRMLTAQHVTPVCCHEPHDLSHAFTTGYIERNSFEEVSGGSMVYEYDHFTEAERRGKLLKDTHPDEHATCYIVQGRGLVVISSCGHVGLINTIQQAMAVSGVSKLHAVIGGFHLVTAPQDYIEQTVTELEALKPDVVIPMHCSGADFIETMRRRMPKQLVTTNVGTRFTFGV